VDTINVLLAEDHALMRDAVKLVFDDAEGVELVGEVANGNDLMPLLSRIDVDFILLDVQLPGLDGLSCLEVLAEPPPPVKGANPATLAEPPAYRTGLPRGGPGYRCGGGAVCAPGSGRPWGPGVSARARGGARVPARRAGADRRPRP